MRLTSTMMMIIPAPCSLNKCNVLIKHILTILLFLVREHSFAKHHMCVAYACSLYGHISLLKICTIYSHLVRNRELLSAAIYWLLLFISMKIATRFVLMHKNLLSFSRPPSNVFRINSLMDH